jgi:hypothetical protein
LPFVFQASLLIRPDIAISALRAIGKPTVNSVQRFIGLNYFVLTADDVSSTREAWFLSPRLSKKERQTKNSRNNQQRNNLYRFNNAWR